MKYRILVEIERPENSKSNYINFEPVYEQIVEGDETLVNGIVQRVLEYNSIKTGQTVKSAPQLSKEGEDE